MQDAYDSYFDPMPDAWLYHPDGYLSTLYRGYVINATPDPLNLSSGSFADQYGQLPQGPFNSYAQRPGWATT